MPNCMFQSMLLSNDSVNGQRVLIKKYDTDADNELVGTATVELPWFNTIVYTIVSMSGAITLPEVDAQIDKWRKT
jgi:hypothetical protein